MLEGQSFIMQVGDAEDFDEPPKDFPATCLTGDLSEKSGANIAIESRSYYAANLFVGLVLTRMAF